MAGITYTEPAGLSADPKGFRDKTGGGVKARTFEDVSTGLASGPYTVAIEAMIQASINEGGTAIMPPNVFSLADGIELEGVPNLVGFDEASVWTIPTNKPHMTCAVAAPQRNRTIGRFKAVNTIGSISNTATSALKLTGDSHLVENCKFNRITSIGCFTTMHNALGTRASIHGEENWFNNNLIEDLWTFYDPALVGAINAKYTFLAEDGSGTGNHFRSFKGNQAWDTGVTAGDLETKPAVLRFKVSSPSTVIGDITFEPGQITAAEAALISCDVGEYMTNVRITNGQLDAQARYLARFTTTPPESIHGWVIDVAVGGEIDPVSSMPLMTESRVKTQGVDSRGTGVYKQGLATGAHTRWLYQIDIAAYTGVEFTFTAHGLVQGVAGGSLKVVGRVEDNTGALAAVTIDSTEVSSGNANFFALTCTPVGLTMKFELVFTASGTGSYYHSNIVTEGLRYKLIRKPQA
ncbi:hypothetical protein KOAAANKH_02526 [Brevundimonas sp. NIBR10]|uniref:hypothetical protein n=1 Tax=Brevundimonas sp. NIBR10 TaxID=3015997 RepID=UPI0022F1D75F|nr:hypothetical protein [Brevundimonas sp. NIBR10]WGM47644.1 hypothetical protein KOAAANKH_02526 [Brevundimonas sp. NIBR10]